MPALEQHDTPTAIYAVQWRAPWWTNDNWQRRWYLRQHQADRKAAALIAQGHEVRCVLLTATVDSVTDYEPAIGPDHGRALAVNRAAVAADHSLHVLDQLQHTDRTTP